MIKTDCLRKIDIPGALSPEECMDELELDKIKSRAWHITYEFTSFVLMSNILKAKQRTEWGGSRGRDWMVMSESSKQTEVIVNRKFYIKFLYSNDHIVFNYRIL